ncbi:MAG: DNA (cytosine-5-)-methyltransferase [Bacteroidota bacterium]
MKLPEIKLSYINPVKKSERQTIKTSEEAARILRKIFNPGELELQEQMMVLYLNNSGDVIGYTKHSVGGITGTVVDTRLILAGALKSLSTGIIISHNHPSGRLQPSNSDITITKKLKEAAKSFDIELIDHIIITKDGHYSFADEGLNGIDDPYKSEQQFCVNKFSESKSTKNDIVLLDLFSGTGGFSKGLEEGGYHIKQHYFSEIDKYAIANYQYNFKNSINLGDVSKINTKKIQQPNIICFGSPCQDISIAGKRKGLKGKRSNLFFEAVRVIRECRPDVFIFENVKGLFSSNQGKDFEIILQTFADLGLYDIQWQLLNTSWFLPQNRERVYFVGCIRGKPRSQIFPIGESSQGGDAFHQKKSQRKSISPTIDTKVGESTHRSPYVLHWKGSSTKWKGGQMKNAPTLNTQQDWIRNPLIVNGAAYRTRNYKGEGGKLELQKDKIANQLTTVQKDSMVILRELTKGEAEHNRVYESKNGLSKTIKSSGYGSGSQTGNYLVNKRIRRLTPTECERLQGFPDNWTKNGVFHVPEATHTGYAIAKRGDSINLSFLEANKRRGRVGKGKANTIATGVQQYTIAKNNLRRFTPIECERLQGFKDNWTKPGLFNGMVETISDSQRYKLLGNAVSVPVVKAIAEKLLGKIASNELIIPNDTLKVLTLELELELLNFKQAA